MQIDLTPGTKLASTVCLTEVIVVRPPDGAVSVECGGTPMVPADDAPDEPAGEPAGGHDEGTPLGKRYHHEATGLELLCTRAGEGSLAADGEPIPLKDAKPLPSSD